MLLVKTGGGKGIHWDGVCRDIAEIRASEPVILVHGANAQRNELAARLSVPVRTVISPSGIASVYTDAEAIEIFLMAYAGLANKQIVARFQKHGVNAVGLCGVDGRLWRAKAKKEILVEDGGKTKLLKGNLTGRVETINAGLLRLLLDNDYLPVVCAPALSYENEIVNTDNDTAAAAMAVSLNIERIVYLFEAPGLLRDADDETSLVPRINRFKIGEFLPFARGRMQRKILGVKQAVDAGVKAVFFGDGRVDSPVKDALAGKGTVIA